MLGYALCVLNLSNETYLPFLSLSVVQKDLFHVFGKHPFCSLTDLNYR